MSYSALMILKNTINKADRITNEINKKTKEEFSSNDLLISVATGCVNELYQITLTIDEDVYILNSDLYNLISSLQEYGRNLLTKHKIANSYKLYDFFKIDLPSLKNFLNKFN